MITLIPAIDIMDGQCVRLSGGDYARKKTYREDPLEVAKEFEQAGLTRLHLVDLDGARSGSVKNLAVLERIASNTELLVDFGGGIKTDAELRSVVNAGANFISVGSVAVKDPEKFDQWIQQYTAGKFFPCADVRDKKIAVAGWQEQTNIGVVEFIREQVKKGITHICCTDISKDGMLAGPATDLYKYILAECPGLRLVASGGVSSIDDIYALNDLGCYGVILGKAIYEGRISLEALAQIQLNRGGC
jgi:phosphoribosylformimino-5-aminoimidazole carboxamide ribotide isomerase